MSTATINRPQEVKLPDLDITVLTTEALAGADNPQALATAAAPETTEAPAGVPAEAAAAEATAPETTAPILAVGHLAAEKAVVAAMYYYDERGIPSMNYGARPHETVPLEDLALRFCNSKDVNYHIGSATIALSAPR